jgi:uncharacterized protein with GYD domain
MPTYIMNGRWTTQGLQNIKESPARLDASKKLFEPLGVRIRDFYMTTGKYDICVILDAPDDSTLAHALLALGSKGSLTTQTVRAFTEDEYRDVIKKLP